MGNVIVQQGAQSVGLFTRLRQIFFWGSFFIIFLLVFYSALSESLATGSATPIINELGSKFLLSTQELQTQSETIIANQGIYVPSESKWENFKSFIEIFGGLYSALFIVYVWLKILMWFYARTPLSEQGKSFINFLLAIATFTVLQIIFLISAGAINKTIDSAADVARLTTIPFIAYWTFLRAIPFMIQPALDTVGKFVDRNVTGVVNGTTNIT